METFVDIGRYIYYAATVVLGGIIYWVRWSITQSTVSQKQFDQHVRDNDRVHADLQAQQTHLATKADVHGLDVQLATVIANQNQHAKQTAALINALENMGRNNVG